MVVVVVVVVVVLVLVAVMIGLAVNVAVTSWSEDSVTAHVPVPEQPPPDQPANWYPAPGLAVSVTCELCGTVTLHLTGHEIPPPLTEPAPFTVTCNVAGGTPVTIFP